MADDRVVFIGRDEKGYPTAFPRDEIILETLRALQTGREGNLNMADNRVKVSGGGGGGSGCIEVSIPDGMIITGWTEDGYPIAQSRDQMILNTVRTLEEKET